MARKSSTKMTPKKSKKGGGLWCILRSIPCCRPVAIIHDKCNKENGKAALVDARRRHAEAEGEGFEKFGNIAQSYGGSARAKVQDQEFQKEVIREGAGMIPGPWGAAAKLGAEVYCNHDHMKTRYQVQKLATAAKASTGYSDAWFAEVERNPELASMVLFELCRQEGQIGLLARTGLNQTLEAVGNTQKIELGIRALERIKDLKKFRINRAYVRR